MDSTTSADWINSGLGTTGTLIGFAVYILFVVALWKIFTKAGRPGILSIIPIVGFIFGFFVAVRLGRGFGKGAIFSVFLLWIFSAIGLLIVGFDGSRYDRSALDAA